MKNILIVILEKKIRSVTHLSNFVIVFNNTIRDFFLNSNLVNNEVLNIYTSNLILNYLIRYNYELKMGYLLILNSIENAKK